MIIKNYKIIILSVLFLVSCQTEEYEVRTEEDQNSIALNTEIYDLIYRTAMYDGSLDDEIDNSPCFSIEFPYSINIQGIRTLISSDEDRRIFLENLPVDLSQELIPDFPIYVVNIAHQRIHVNNRQQYAGLRQACRNLINQGRGPISCVKFLFPVRVNSYNSASQQASTTILNSQSEMFSYLDNLGNNTVIDFAYPLDILNNDQNFQVNNSNELRNQILECSE